jgi:hypothetical protein
MDEDVEFYREDSSGNKPPRYYNRRFTLIILYAVFGILLFCSSDVVFQDVVVHEIDYTTGIIATSIILSVIIILLLSWQHFLLGFSLLFAELIILFFWFKTTNIIIWLLFGLSWLCCVGAMLYGSVIALLVLSLLIFLHITGIIHPTDAEIRSVTVYFSLAAAASILGLTFSSGNLSAETIDSVDFKNNRYYLTVQPGWQDDTDRLYLYRCSRFGIFCEKIYDSTLDYLLPYHHYRSGDSELVINHEQGTIDIIHDGEILYSYPP